MSESTRDGAAPPGASGTPPEPDATSSAAAGAASGDPPAGEKRVDDADVGTEATAPTAAAGAEEPRAQDAADADATAPASPPPPDPARTDVGEVVADRGGADTAVAAGGVARFEVLTVEDFARRSQPLADRRAGPDTARSAPPRTARTTVDQSRADLRRRVLARLIDVAIFALLSESVTYLGPLVALVYLLLGDGLLDGASVGKRLARLRVLRARDGKPASVFDSLLRNAPLGIAGLFVLIPLVGWALFVTLGLVVVLFEGYLVFTDPRGVRAGDILAGTQVHEAGPALPGGGPPAAGGGTLPA